MPPVPEMTPTEFCERWPAAARASQVTLLDVREHVELELAAVEGAMHIPMREVPARLAELDRDAPLVVMCHSGGRSKRVAEYLSHRARRSSPAGKWPARRAPEKRVLLATTLLRLW